MDTNQNIPETHPLHRLFRGLTESTFMEELGIGDPRLVGYVSNLLADFVRVRPGWRVGERDGEALSRVLSMVADAESAPEDELRRERHRRVGDMTLFWTGVFPEILTRLQAQVRIRLGWGETAERTEASKATSTLRYRLLDQAATGMPSIVDHLLCST